MIEDWQITIHYDSYKIYFCDHTIGRIPIWLYSHICNLIICGKLPQASMAMAAWLITSKLTRMFIGLRLYVWYIIIMLLVLIRPVSSAHIIPNITVMGILGRYMNSLWLQLSVSLKCLHCLLIIGNNLTTPPLFRKTPTLSINTITRFINFAHSEFEV